MVKGRDTLPALLKASIARMEDRLPNSAANLVHNWNDGNNDTVNFPLDSEIEIVVKRSHRCK